MTLLWLTRLAAAATRLVLPASEDPAAWSAAAALAGLTLDGDDPTTVTLVSGPTSWRVVAEVAGRRREASIAAPVDQDGREDAAWLGQALVRELTPTASAAEPEQVPEPTRTPTPTLPVAAAAPEAPPVPDPAPDLAPPPAACPEPPTPPAPAPPPAEPSAPPWVVRVGAAAAARARTSPGARASLGVGTRVGRAEPFVEGALLSARTVEGIDGAPLLRTGALHLGAVWVDDTRWSPQLGVAAGVTAHSLSEAGASRGTAWTPSLRTEAGLRWAAGPASWITFGLITAVDLTRTRLVRVEGPAMTLDRAEIAAALTVGGRVWP